MLFSGGADTATRPKDAKRPSFWVLFLHARPGYHHLVVGPKRQDAIMMVRGIYY
jgi:hypothetical protein